MLGGVSGAWLHPDALAGEPGGVSFRPGNRLARRGKPAQLGPAPVADGHDRKRAEQGQVQQGKRAKHGEACEQVAVSSESEKSQRPDRHHCQTGPPRKVALEIQIVAVADGTPERGPFRGEEGGSFYLPLP